jgi:hypothetical protein
MALRHSTTIPQPAVLTAKEGKDFFDREVTRLTGMSGEEFLQRFDDGRIPSFDETAADRDLTYLIMLIPFGRPDR